MDFSEIAVHNPLGPESVVITFSATVARDKFDLRALEREFPGVPVTVNLKPICPQFDPNDYTKQEWEKKINRHRMDAANYLSSHLDKMRKQSVPITWPRPYRLGEE